jgi:hypothetical protein
MTMSAPKLRPGNLFAPPRDRRFAELLRLHEPESAHHLVQFYEDESLVVENVSYLASKALEAGTSAVIAATAPHLEQIRVRLADSVPSLDAARESGRYVTIDAAEVLSQLLVEGRPDEAKFDDLIGATIRSAAKNSANGFVFAFGEIVALLCAANNANGAVRLEQLWNALAQRQRFSLYCAYPLTSLGIEPDADALMQICAEHALTIPTESHL